LKRKQIYIPCMKRHSINSNSDISLQIYLLVCQSCRNSKNWLKNSNASFMITFTTPSSREWMNTYLPPKGETHNKVNPSSMIRCCIVEILANSWTTPTTPRCTHKKSSLTDSCLGPEHYLILIPITFSTSCILSCCKCITSFPYVPTLCWSKP